MATTVKTEMIDGYSAVFYNYRGHRVVELGAPTLTRVFELVDEFIEENALLHSPGSHIVDGKFEGSWVNYFEIGPKLYESRKVVQL